MSNWYFGWAAILAAFVTGALLGMFFYRDDFLGGYDSFRRRMLRLGHIALVGLGVVNLLYALGTRYQAAGLATWPAEYGFIVGGITMPAVCFLSAWRPGFRHLFFIPVVCLIVAVIRTLRIGLP